MWQNAKSDSWYFHLQESHSEEKNFLHRKRLTQYITGRGKGSWASPLSKGNYFYKQHLKYAPFEDILGILITHLSSISSLWVALPV